MKSIKLLALVLMCGVLVGRPLAARPNSCDNPLIVTFEDAGCGGYGSASCNHYCEFDLRDCTGLPCHYAWDTCDDGGGVSLSVWTCQCNCEE